MPTSPIAAHHAALKRAGLDLGAASGAEQDAGYGGRYQVYERGRIYWHATTGAHALTGRILERYLQAGGHDVNPATGERELGFPSSDHITTEDGRYWCATFEWGTIAEVSGTPLVRIFGRLHEVWRKEGGPLGRLGHPLGDVTRIEGGRAVWFEGGVLWHSEGSRDVLIGELVAPTVGHPALVDPASPGALEWIRFDGAVATLDAKPGLGAALTRGRLGLVAVGGGPGVDLVPAAAPTSRDGAKWLAFSIPGSAGSDYRGVRGVMVDTGARAADSGMVSDGGGGGGGGAGATATNLADRQLYSLAFKTPGMAPRVISAHCLYAKSKWETFGLAHITDLHVSRRIEHYRAKLRETGVAEPDVAQLNQWNDAFRGFVRYANHLHRQGLLDAVMATGDLVDYVREVDDHPDGPGNFAFLEGLIRGEVAGPDPESPAAEPLRVPIFTSLGNHDYRMLPYSLGWDLQVTTSDLLSTIPWVGDVLAWVRDGISATLRKVPGLGIIDRADIVDLIVGVAAGVQWNHSGLNTTHDEALRLMGLTKDGKNFAAPRLRPKAAAKAVTVERGMKEGTGYYFRRINRARSYVVRLGAHRVVMLDTRWDADIVTDIDEFALTKLGFGSESAENFVAAHPDSVGVEAGELNLIRSALAEAGDSGLVIVGMHAEPLHPSGSDLAHFLRETSHPTAPPAQVAGWLVRRVKAELMRSPAWHVEESYGGDVRPGWVRTGTAHFHEGPVDDLLDEGTAVGEQEKLVEMLAGVGVSRPITLLLCGHGHYRMEYRLRWDAEKRKLLTFTDHYLGNPTSYYPTRVVEGDWRNEDNHKRYLVGVKPGASPEGEVVQIRDHRSTIWPERAELRVPPYGSPLGDAADPAAWWKAHAPVVVQTGALGPCTNTRESKQVNEQPPGPNFQGFRLMQVKDNVIHRVQYIGTPELLRGSFPLAWETGRGLPELHIDPVIPPPIRGGDVREHITREGRVVRDHRREPR